jgi:hypothetical protein
MTKLITIVMVCFGISAWSQNFNTESSPLIPAKTFVLGLSQSDLKAQDLKAEATVFCRYSSGIVFPETKSCGKTSIPASVNTQGVVSVAAVPAFPGIHGGNIDNYEYAVHVHRGNDAIFSISGDGKESIKAVLALGSIIEIVKMHGAKIDLQYKGQDFFKTNLVNVPDSSLNVKFQTSEDEDYNKNYLLISEYSANNIMMDNRGYTVPDRQLNKQSQLVLRDSYYATTKPLNGQTLSIWSHYETKPGPNKFEISARKTVPFSSQALQKMGTLELEETKSSLQNER